MSEFPGCRPYLDEHLYPIRRQWAWPWVGREFTAGIRTNGRSEAENRVNKSIGGPKTTAFELFTALNERSEGQSRLEHIGVRQTARHKHDGDIKQVFPGPLEMIRQYCGPFALQTSYRQMQLSMYYLFEVMQKPQGREAQPWVCRFLILHLFREANVS